MKKAFGNVYTAYIVVILVMVLSLNLSITVGFSFPYPLWKTVLWTAAITLLFTLWSFYKKADIVVAAAVIAVLVSVYIRDRHMLISAVSFARNMISWAASYMDGVSKYAGSYAVVLLWCIYVLIGFAMPFLIIRWKQTFVPVVGGLLVFVVQWYGFVDEAIYYMLLFIASAIVLIALRSYERQQELKGKDALRNWMRLGSVISVAAIGITMTLPLDIAPVSWQWLNDRIIQTFPVVREWRGGDRSHPLASVDLSHTFDLTQTGMQKSQSLLGGPAVQDNTLALIVHSPQKTYLRAVVYDVYNGRGWEHSASKWYAYNSGVPMDDSFARGVETYKLRITIEPVRIRTDTLFAPWQPLTVYKQDNSQYYGSDAYELMNPDGRMRTAYTVESLLPIVKVDKLKSSGYNYPLPIIRQYLQLPRGIVNDAVKEEAMRITEQYGNPYDKVKAVENYLRQFPYTLDVPYTPRGRELVDYFIFDLKKGYCVYYATAMAVMLRSIGIPARYVTGFAMPDEPVKDDIYEIPNSKAHAWVEVYFNGFGWLPFEPTPAYPASHYDDAVEAGTNAAGGYDDYYEQYMNYMNQLNQSAGDYVPSDSTNADITLPDEAPKYSGWWLSLWGLLTLVAALIARVAYVWLIMYRRKKRWIHSGYKEGIVAYYGIICALMEHWGLSIWPGETPMEFAERVCRYMGSQRFKVLTDIFQRARYSPQPMTKAELDEMVAYYKRVLDSVRQQPGIYVKYLWRRYLLNAM